MNQYAAIWILSFTFFSSYFSYSQNIHPSDSLKYRIDQIMKPLATTNNYSGCVLIESSDTVLISENYGMADKELQIPASDETRYMLASTSMIFTSAAIMKLVEEGRLSLTDKLSKYMPNFTHANKITIHHMMSQRSGIPAWDGGWKVSNFNRDEPHSINRLITYFEDEELLFEPGTRYSHGRSEYILLAAIIEYVSGMSYGDYLKSAIFEPLGMHHTGHFSDKMIQEDVSSLAIGYTEEGFSEVSKAPRIHWSVKTGHASVFSTAGDLRKFGRAVLNGDLLIGESWKTMLTDYGSNVGYGWFLNPQGGIQRYQMNGRSPGFSSYFGLYPEQDLIVIMLSNRYVSLPFFVGPELAAAALGGEYEVLNLSLEPVNSQLESSIKGHYQMGADFYRPNGVVKIKSRNGRMYSGNYPLLPILDGNGEIEAFIHRHYWSRLIFDIHSNGHVILHFDDYQGEKVGFLKEWKWFIAVIGLIVLAVAIIIHKKNRSNARSLNP